MSKYILPAFIFIIILWAFIKKVPVYDNFVKGSKESISLILSIFPYICAVLIAVELFSLSGLNSYLAKIMSPVLTVLGIPDELCELLIIRPLSGNGSLALLEGIYKTHGADSYIARCACVCYGSSETVFYISAVYFAGIKVKRLAVPIAAVFCALSCPGAYFISSINL